ncbi:MAG: hypothetical protein J2P16_04480 [Mycobacterium sp.]|nr:hypothetical protein [Mycobacterium sp.]
MSLRVAIVVAVLGLGVLVVGSFLPHWYVNFPLQVVGAIAAFFAIQDIAEIRGWTPATRRPRRARH